MSRFGKYFLQNILQLEDEFCRYFVQDNSWGHQDILDVEYAEFDWEEEALSWLAQCAEYDPSTTIRRLRDLLAEDCLTQYRVHRMDNRQVLRTAADELCMNAWRVVIEPKIGWAVRVDQATRQPVPTIAVEPADDIDGMLAELKAHLDAIVAEAQKKKEQHQAALAGKNSAEVALYYSENTGDAVYQDQVVGTWDMLVSAVKKFPGFYMGYLKTMWKISQYPGKMAKLTRTAVLTGDINPLKEEIDRIVDPVVHGYEQAMHYKSILTILLSDQQTYAMLWDFSQRYYDASHPVELARLGATAAAEIVVTIVLALLSYGIGAAANIAAKSNRLVKVAKLLEKIALAIRKTKRARALVENAEEAAAKTGKTAKRAKRAKKGIPDVEKPKAVEKLDDKAKRGYDGDKKSDGSKKTTRRTGIGATGEGIPIERVKPEVLKEVHPDSKAAYGYSPNKGTAYEKVDFTDVEAAKKNRGIRTEYLDGSKRIENDIETMRAKGSSSEEIGRHVVNERNLQKVDARKHMKPDEIKVLEERNLKKYDNPIGPTADDIFEGTKENLIDKGLYESDTQVWDHVIEKSMKKDDVINTLLGIEH